jgi:RHS repeat-associated protein
MKDPKSHAGWAVRIGVAALLAVTLGAWSALASAQTAAPYTTAYYYNSDARLVGTVDPNDGSGHYAAVYNKYNAQGLLSSVQKGQLAAWPTSAPPWSGYTVFQQTDYTYDIWGRKLTEQLSGVVSGVATAYTLMQYTYDTSGRVECSAQRMNSAAFGSLPGSACTLGTQGTQGPDRITYTTYDALSRPLQIVKAYGTPVQYTYATYTYYPNGPLQSTTDANRNYSYYTYDPLVRLSNFYFPSKTTTGQYSTTDYEQYGYDANGNRTSLRKRDTNTITYSYDNLNRRTQTTYPAGTLQNVVYDYDLRNLQLSAFFGSSSGPGITTVYDGFGNISSSSNNVSGTAWTLSYQYDADGDRTQIAHPDGNYFVYGYDGLDRLTQITENGATTVIAGLVYDNEGRRYTLTRGARVTTTTYGYDPVSRLQTLSHNLNNSSTYSETLTFSYTPANQIATRNLSNGIYSIGDISKYSITYTPNGLNQYTQITSTTTANPTYDPNGNLTFDGTTTFGYDEENRLTSASGGAHTATLSYDPRGRLYQTSGGSSGTTLFLYDGDALVAEYNGSGTLLRRYVHGSGVDEPLVWYEGATVSSSTRRYLHANHQGSIVAVTDGNGNSIATDVYDPYGSPGANNQGRFQYTGQIEIPELGLFYYKARIYNPTLGRFMQTDPVGYQDDLDLYTYVGNDPMDRTDPTGRGGVCTKGSVSDDPAGCGDERNKKARDDSAEAPRTLWQKMQDFAKLFWPGSHSTNSSENAESKSEGNKEVIKTEAETTAAAAATAASESEAAGGVVEVGAGVLNGGAGVLNVKKKLAEADYNFWKATREHKYQQFDGYNWRGANFDEALKNRYQDLYGPPKQ